MQPCCLNPMPPPSSDTADLASLQGLQQHIEASHDLFDFGYPKAEPGGCPTVEVRCPPDLYDQQGKLQTLETDDLHDDKGKVRPYHSLQLLSIFASSLWA